MTSTQSWPVPVAAVGSVAVATTLWRLGEALHVTVVVKATLHLVPGGVMTIAEPEPVHAQDVHEGGNPLKSLSAVRETVPGLQWPEVLCFGHAYAPPSSQGSTTQRQVRLGLRRGEQVVLDKCLLIVGDRIDGGATAPFERIPLSHERSLGGIGCADNPLGVGLGPSAGTLPNVLSAVDPEQQVAGLGPIPPTFLARKQLLAGTPRDALEQANAAIPADLDWTYFQASPQDQRVDAIGGDEVLELDGLSREADQLRSQLPGLQGAVRVYGAGGAGVPTDVPMRADLLQIRPDEQRCSLIWRGSFPVRDEATASALVIAGAAARRGAAIDWPATPPLTAPAASASRPAMGVVAAADTPLDQLDGTRELDPSTPPAPSAGLPFAAGTSSSTPPAPSTAGLPFAPGTSTGAPAVPPPVAESTPPAEGPSGHPLEATHALDPAQQGVAASAAAVPFVASSSRPPPQVPAPEQIPLSQTQPLGETQALDGGGEITAFIVPDPVEVSAGAALPFGEDASAEPAAAEQAATERAAAEQATTERAAVEQAAAEQAAAEQAAAEQATAQQAAAEEAAAAEAAAEAEARRQEAQARFEAEQEAARAEEKRRREAQLASRRKSATTLRTDMYGGFRKKG